MRSHCDEITDEQFIAEQMFQLTSMDAEFGATTTTQVCRMLERVEKTSEKAVKNYYSFGTFGSCIFYLYNRIRHGEAYMNKVSDFLDRKAQQDIRIEKMK